MRHRWRQARWFLLLVAAILVLSGNVVAQPAAKPAQRKQNAREDNWPKTIHMGDTTIFLDAPQAESLEGTKLKARGTARLQPEGETESSYATVWYEADVSIDRDRRTVTLVSVNIPRVQLAGAPPARQQRIATRLTQAVSRLQPQLPLDDVLASAKLTRRRDEAPPKLNTDPPKILVETEPAILVIFDGEPRFKAVEGSRLERALNTPFLVLHDASTSAFYLDGGTTWFRASSPMGPWAKADKVPSEAV